MSNYREYEIVAESLLRQFASDFGLTTVEGQQKIIGEHTNYNIEAKGIYSSSEDFAIIECRRLTTKGISQESMGAFCYRIKTTGASGGILITPIEPQSGAKKIAKGEEVTVVILDSDSSLTDFIMRYEKLRI